ncbi:hypothetical protein ABK040_014125 [Willaertia magna]
MQSKKKTVVDSKKVVATAPKDNNKKEDKTKDDNKKREIQAQKQLFCSYLIKYIILSFPIILFIYFTIIYLHYSNVPPSVDYYESYLTLTEDKEQSKQILTFQNNSTKEKYVEILNRFESNNDNNIKLYEEIKYLDENKIKGILIVVHDFGLHSGLTLKSTFEQEILLNNFLIYYFDFRGHGKSSGQRCFVNNFNNTLLNDLDQVINERIPTIKNQLKLNENIPLFILSDSIGGLITMAYQKYKDYKINNLIKGFIFNSVPLPGFDLKLTPIKNHLLKFLMLHTPSFPIKSFIPSINLQYFTITKDLNRVKEVINDPWKCHGVYIFSEQQLINFVLGDPKIIYSESDDEDEKKELEERKIVWEALEKENKKKGYGYGLFNVKLSLRPDMYTITTGNALLRLMEQVQDYKEDENKTLVLFGTEDFITKVEQVKEVFKHVNIYNEKYRDLLNELDNENVLKDILNFMNQKV